MAKPRDTEPEPPWRRSGLGRSIDPRLGTHRVALAGATAGGALGGAWHRWHLDQGWTSSAWSGLWIGVAVFLAWACGRELDPDREWPAQLALPVGAGLALTGSVRVAACLLVLLALRLAAGTIGTPLRAADVAWLPLLAGWASTQSRGGLVASLAAALGLAWALHVGHVARGSRRVAHATLVLLPVVAVACAVLADRLEPRWPNPHGWHLALEVAVLLAAAVVAAVPPRPVRSRCDDGSRAIATAHVRAGRVLCAALLVAALALGGVAQLASLTAPAAAVVACALAAALTTRPAAAP
jgi:hypothetical protein